MEAILTIHGGTAEILILTSSGVETLATDIAVRSVTNIFDHAEYLLAEDGYATARGAWRRDRTGSGQRYVTRLY